MLRLLQIAVLIPFTKITSGLYHIDETRKQQCQGSGEIETLVDASFILFVTFLCSAYFTVVAGLIIEIAIWRTGAKGTPVEPEKRACLKPLCFLKMIPMSVLRVANMVMGVMIIRVLRQLCFCGGLYDNPYILCPRLDLFKSYLAVLIVSFFVEAGVVGCMGLYFACKTQSRLPSLFSAEAKWRCCCRCCCTVTSLMTCCLYGGRDGKTGDFADIALILADYFDDGGTLDVVPSDIVIGLRMLARVQNQKQSECRVDLKRRVSFIASVKPGVKMDLNEANFEDLKPVADPERLRLVTVNEEAGNETSTDSDNGSKQAKDDAFEAHGKGEWTASLEDEEMGKVSVRPGVGGTILSNEEPAIGERPEDSLLSIDLEMTKELAKAALLDEEQEDDNDVVLERVGSQKSIRRRKAVIYNLHRTGGNLMYKPAVREVLSRKSADDKLAIAEGARFMRYAMGIYSFRKYIAGGRTCELCCAVGDKVDATVIEAGRKCVNCCRNKANSMAGHDFLNSRIGHGYLIGDIMEAKFLALAGLDRAEIKYVQFGEGVARTPYCISVDHAWKSIVITIRGTEGLDDVVADLRMVPVSMEECGAKCGFNGKDYFVHAGMLACAEWIYDDLKR